MKVSWQGGDRTVQVAPGVVIALPGVATFAGVEVDEGLVDVRMELDCTPEGVRPVKVLVIADGAPITGTTLRGIRVWDLTRAALSLAVMRGQGSPDGLGPSAASSGGLVADQVGRLRAQGPVLESLEWAAYVYNVAKVLGDPPAKAVELTFDMPRTTASKWVRRARDLGLIEED